MSNLPKLDFPATYNAFKEALASKESVRSRLALGSFWSLLGAIISQGLGLLASLLTARILGKLGFGELGMINSTIGMIGTFAGLGLGLSATKYVAELQNTDPRNLGKILSFLQFVTLSSAAFATLVLFSLAPFLANRTLNAPHLISELRIGSGLVFFNSLNGFQVGILAGFEAFKSIARVSFKRGLLNFPLMIAGVWFLGLNGAVMAMVLVTLVGCVMNHLAVQKESERAGIHIPLFTKSIDFSILWNFSLPSFLSSSMLGPVTWIAHTMLVNQQNGYAEMGVFNAANQWRNFIAFVPAAIMQPTLPLLSSMHGEKRFNSYQKVFWYSFGIISVITLLTALSVSFASPWIMSLYGKGFYGEWRTLVLLSLASVLNVSLGVVGQSIASAGNMWWGFILNAIWAGILILTASHWVTLGAVGLAGSFLVAYLVHLVTSTVYVYIFILRKSYTER